MGYKKQTIEIRFQTAIGMTEPMSIEGYVVGKFVIHGALTASFVLDQSYGWTMTYIGDATYKGKPMNGLAAFLFCPTRNWACQCAKEFQELFGDDSPADHIAWWQAKKQDYYEAGGIRH